MTTSHIVEDHPLRILNHSGKHGYTELSDIAAEISVRCSLADAGRQITHPGILGKWVGSLFSIFNLTTMPIEWIEFSSARVL